MTSATSTKLAAFAARQAERPAGMGAMSAEGEASL
jgi:hypothetical protein